MNTDIVIRKLPGNFAEEDRSYFEDDLQFQLPVPNVQLFRNAFVLKDGAVIVNRRLVGESLADKDKHAKNYDKKFFIKSLVAFEKHFFFTTPIAVVYDAWSSNIFHWINDVLPRLFQVVDHQDYAIILPTSYKKYDYVLMAINALQLMNRIVWITDDSFVFARKLMLPSHVAYSGNYNPAITRRVSLFFLDLRGKKSLGERIYVSRAKATSRRVINELHVETLLKTYGFVTVFLEEYSFADQIAIVSSASALIAPHGAGLTHMMFMKEGASVIEFRTYALPTNNCYFNLANVFNLNFYYLLCTSPGNKSDFQFDDMEVSLEKLSSLVQRVL